MASENKPTQPLPADWMISIERILGKLQATKGPGRVHFPIRHGTMRAGIYAPWPDDPQKPHDQDELYIVLSGEGSFVKGEQRRAFKPGDLIFVEAGVPHRFEEFDEGFATWVVFWGPEGGE